jgi:hypothetical protein
MLPATAGWQQQGGKPQLQIPFSELSPDFFFLCLPTFDERTTKLHPQAEKLTETVLHLNLGHLVGFFFCACVCRFVLLYLSPLTRQLQNNIWGTISGLETETDTQIINWNFIAFELGGFLVFWFFGFLNFLFFHFTLIHFYIQTFLSFTYFLFLFLSFFYFWFSILSLSL